MNNFPYTKKITDNVSKIKKSTTNFYSNPLNIEFNRIRNRTNSFWSDNISTNIEKIIKKENINFYSNPLNIEFNRIRNRTTNFYSNPLNIEFNRIRNRTNSFWSDNISTNIEKIKTKFYDEFHPTYFVVLEFLNSNGGLI